MANSFQKLINARSDLKKQFISNLVHFWRFLFESFQSRVIDLRIRVKQNAKIKVFRVCSLMQLTSEKLIILFNDTNVGPILYFIHKYLE